jgi:hypothetical protein
MATRLTKLQKDARRDAFMGSSLFTTVREIIAKHRFWCSVAQNKDHANIFSAYEDAITCVDRASITRCAMLIIEYGEAMQRVKSAGETTRAMWAKHCAELRKLIGEFQE